MEKYHTRLLEIVGVVFLALGVVTGFLDEPSASDSFFVVGVVLFAGGILAKKLDAISEYLHK